MHRKDYYGNFLSVVSDCIHVPDILRQTDLHEIHKK